MRISDVIVITSEIHVKKDKFRGVYYVCMVKNFRAGFHATCAVNMYIPDGAALPTKHTYVKGVATKMADIAPTSLWRVIDIHIEGRQDKRDPNNIHNLNRVSIYCVPYERDDKFFEKYIKHTMTREDNGTYDARMGWKNIGNDGKGYQPFVYWKFIKYIFRNRHLYLKGFEEAAVTEQVLLDKIEEIEKLKKEIERLENISAVAQNLNLYYKNGKLKKKFYKDLKV